MSCIDYFHVSQIRMQRPTQYNKAYILFKSWKMLQKLGERGLWKLGVYFMYLCGQVLILGTLMLITSSMVGQTLMMLFTIALYFAVCFKDPGTYVANQEPNLQDISNNRNRGDFRNNNKKKIVSDQIHQKDLNDVIREEQAINLAAPKPHKKTSIEQKTEMERQEEVKSEEKDSSLKVPSNNTLEAVKMDGNIVASAKNIFSAAKNVLGNFTSFMSKQNIDNGSIEGKQNIVESLPKSARSIRVESEEGHPYTINVIKTPSQQAEHKKAQQEVRQARNEREQESRNEKQVAQIGNRGNKAKSVGQKMQQKRRYCRICEFYQPLRVRHCHSCEQCISTFDHHCPWLSTCIGEKNKLAFIAYLFAQALQFLVISIDLIHFLSEDHSSGSASVGILLLAVILILLVLVLLLSFHIYLAANNITTWQLFRWDKVQYLCLFDKKLTRSPFSKGWKQNFKTLWDVTVEEQPRKWEEDLPEGLSKFLLRGKGSCREHEAATERKMFLSQGNL